MIPLGGEDSQQYQAMNNGRFLYSGGFAEQPIKTLVGAQLIGAVRSLHREATRKRSGDDKFDMTKLTPTQQQLLMVVDSGDS